VVLALVHCSLRFDHRETHWPRQEQSHVLPAGHSSPRLESHRGSALRLGTPAPFRSNCPWQPSGCKVVKKSTAPAKPAAA
jgi:hypothetical protein